MAEYNFQTFIQMHLRGNSHRICLSTSKNEFLQCMSHRICPCVSNKQIFSVTVTELDFVFYNKTVRDISKNIKNQHTLRKFFALVLCLYSYF